MSELPDSLRDKPLQFLAIPGSHDSFTYSLSPKSNVGPDERQWLKELAKRLGIVTKPIIFHWSVCQDLSCRQQLQVGVRYFDFRLGKDVALQRTKRTRWKGKTAKKYIQEATSTIRILHGLFGMRFEETLNEIKAFLDDNPGEVVVLDFQHIYGCNDEDVRYILATIANTFKHRMCPAQANVSLAFMQRNQYQVIAVVSHFMSWVGDETSNFFWPRRLCPNPWANTTSVSKLKKFLSSGLASRNKNLLFVSQAVLTPDSSTVILHLFSTLKNCLAKKCNAFLGNDWIPNLSTRLAEESVNIVMFDFVTEAICKAIIEVNFRTRIDQPKHISLLDACDTLCAPKPKTV